VSKREEMLKRLKDLGITFQWITCDKCPERETCEFAYDTYNTDGDCLALK